MLLRSPRTFAKDVPLSGKHYEPTRNCLERDDNIDRDELRLRALRWAGWWAKSNRRHGCCLARLDIRALAASLQSQSPDF
jgi:hypothetical protein